MGVPEEVFCMIETKSLVEAYGSLEVGSARGRNLLPKYDVRDIGREVC